jgi:hypothetical protein
MSDVFDENDIEQEIISLVKVCKANMQCYWHGIDRIICCHYCSEKFKCCEQCESFLKKISYDNCTED